jgi:hypothetical protein
MSTPTTRESEGVGLHGKGVFGISPANQKGHKRGKCSVCGKVYVIGGRDPHNLNSDDRPWFCHRYPDGKPEYATKDKEE